MGQILTTEPPKSAKYDVIVVGGAMYGSSVSWFLSSNPDFDGTILVVERDPTYEFTSTARTNSCIRQQFTADINVRISQFGADYVKNFRAYMGSDDRIPEVPLQSFGYMYLANTEEFAASLKASQKLQQQNGAGTRHMSAEEILADYPFYNVEDIIAGNHNLIDEGYFEGSTLFDWWKRKARENGVEYLQNEVVAMDLNEAGTKVETVHLSSGEEISCGLVINASGPRAARTSRMIGVDIPVEPRKRYTYIFAAEKPLDRDLPLTIDPSGVHMRTDGAYYLAGCPPYEDPAVDYDDFEEDHTIWEEKAWPAIANRIPQFDAIKLVNSWPGHYAYNYFDHNAIVGAHPEVSNFYFLNGFSGHGFQQSPAIGRGLSELVCYGEYRNIDLTPLCFERIMRNEPFHEGAVI